MLLQIEAPLVKLKIGIFHEEEITFLVLKGPIADSSWDAPVSHSILQRSDGTPVRWFSGENSAVNTVSRNFYHRHHNTQVLQRLRQHHLYLKLEKCKFHHPTVQFLGYIISQEGIQMDQGKVTAITEWPIPQSVKELQRFLWFSYLYRCIIKAYIQPHWRLCTEGNPNPCPGTPLPMKPSRNSRLPSARLPYFAIRWTPPLPESEPCCPRYNICCPRNSLNLHTSILLQETDLLTIPCRPWSHVGIDFVTDLHESGGHTCILVAVDRFSKACKLIPLRWLPYWRSGNRRTIIHPCLQELWDTRRYRLWPRPAVYFPCVESLLPSARGHGKLVLRVTSTENWPGWAEDPGTWTLLPGRSVGWNRFLPWAEYAQNSVRQNTPGLTPLRFILRYQPPLFLWTGEPSEIPAVDYWFRASERVRDSVHIYLQQAVQRQKNFVETEKEKVHKQQRWPQAWEYCQAKLIQTLGRVSQGVDWSWGQGIKSHQAQMSSGKGLSSNFWNRNNVRSILPGLRRKRPGLLLSGPKSSFQINLNLAIHLEIRVWRKTGEAHNTSCLKSSL